MPAAGKRCGNSEGILLHESYVGVNIELNIELPPSAVPPGSLKRITFQIRTTLVATVSEARTRGSHFEALQTNSGPNTIRLLLPAVSLRFYAPIPNFLFFVPRDSLKISCNPRSARLMIAVREAAAAYAAVTRFCSTSAA
jgi:hypothetical protein